MKETQVQIFLMIIRRPCIAVAGMVVRVKIEIMREIRQLRWALRRSNLYRKPEMSEICLIRSKLKRTVMVRRIFIGFFRFIVNWIKIQIRAKISLLSLMKKKRNIFLNQKILFKISKKYFSVKKLLKTIFKKLY